MFDTVNGLPVHALVVHAVVVLVPLAAVLFLAALLSRRVRERAGIVTPLLATVALALVPLASESGESLMERVGETPLVEEHAELGETLWPFVLVLVLAAWAHWWLTRAAARQGSSGSAAGGEGPGSDRGRRQWTAPLVAVAVVGAIASAGALVQVVRIGDSGAQADARSLGANPRQWSKAVVTPGLGHPDRVIAEPFRFLGDSYVIGIGLGAPVA